MTLNEKALEAASSNGAGTTRAIIADYFASLAEQGIVLVDVREATKVVRLPVSLLAPFEAEARRARRPVGDLIAERLMASTAVTASRAVTTSSARPNVAPRKPREG